jgi:hypothetical protein
VTEMTVRRDEPSRLVVQTVVLIQSVEYGNPTESHGRRASDLRLYHGVPRNPTSLKSTTQPPPYKGGLVGFLVTLRAIDAKMIKAKTTERGNEVDFADYWITVDYIPNDRSAGHDGWLRQRLYGYVGGKVGGRGSTRVVDAVYDAASRSMVPWDEATP